MSSCTTFVIINAEGHYAIEGLTSGFGPTKRCLYFQPDLHKATVFSNHTLRGIENVIGVKIAAKEQRKVVIQEHM